MHDPSDEKMHDLGTEKYLFLDYEMIDQQGGLQLRVNPARKEEVVIRGEHPWERGIVSRPSVVEHEGRYHMWYNARPASDDWNGPGEGVLCYAVSKDGVHWEKPSLGICEWEGSTDNNIVLRDNGGTETCVFLDPSAAPEERFKLLATYYMVHVGKEWGLYLASSADGLSWSQPQRVLPFCPDTLNGAFYDESLGRYVAYLRGNIGSRRIVVRTEMEDISAPWPYETPPWSRERLLAHGDSPRAADERLESTPTFQFPLVLAADDLDPVAGTVSSDIYTPSVMKYRAGRAYFAFPALFVRREHDPGDGPIELQLAVSRDGRRFWRPDRTPYLPLGEKDTSEDGGMMFMGLGALEVAAPEMAAPDVAASQVGAPQGGVPQGGETIYHYYSCRFSTHSEERYHPELFPQVDGKPVLERLSVIKRASQEKDRLIGLAADRGGGELVTAPFTFAGRHLELDVDCGGTGSAQVEILDEHGSPIWGYDLQLAEKIFLNRRHARVRWKVFGSGDRGGGRSGIAGGCSAGNSGGDSGGKQGTRAKAAVRDDLSALAGRPVRLHILLRSARLYGMQFVE